MNRKGSRGIGFLIFISFFIFLLSPPAFADWLFAVLGDSREDYKRDQVFPEMIQELNQTACQVKDQELRPGRWITSLSHENSRCPPQDAPGLAQSKKRKF